MRRALISDIHGNLEALEVVLDDIKSQGITEIFCLGDIIGYGPNPRECIDRVMETCKVTLLGNHDQGAMFDPEGFNIGAERAIFWTRDQLENSGDRANNEKRWEFLGELPRTYRVGPYLFVHGSPRNPLSEYIFPEDIYNHRKMERLVPARGPVLFPGAHARARDLHREFPVLLARGDRPGVYAGRREADGQRGLGGSAARRRQPCVLRALRGRPGRGRPPPGDGEAPTPAQSPKITYRRLPYDFETTIRKIYSIPELEPFLGDRLRQGR